MHEKHQNRLDRIVSASKQINTTNAAIIKDSHIFNLPENRKAREYRWQFPNEINLAEVSNAALLGENPCLKKVYNGEANFQAKIETLTEQIARRKAELSNFRRAARVAESNNKKRKAEFGLRAVGKELARLKAELSDLSRIAAAKFSAQETNQ